MTKKAHLLHLLAVAGTTTLSILAEALTTGQLSHAAWAVPALFLVNYLRKLAGGPPAVPPAVALFLVAAIGLSGCPSLGPTPPPGTPGFVNCSDSAVHQAALNLLPSVENALATGNWESALLTIVASVGGPLALAEVSCAVLWVESKAQTNVTATADSLEATKAAHAKAWLEKHPVTFVDGGAP